MCVLEALHTISTKPGNKYSYVHNYIHTISTYPGNADKYLYMQNYIQRKSKKYKTIRFRTISKHQSQGLLHKKVSGFGGQGRKKVPSMKGYA